MRACVDVKFGSNQQYKRSFQAAYTFTICIVFEFVQDQQ